jgi:hypothetical protein
MSFVAAMSAPDLTKQGVKGSDVYTEAGVGDLRVSFFTMLVRGLGRAELTAQVNKFYEVWRRDPVQAKEYVRDLLVIAFQTRDVRGGKGERDLFYHILGAVCEKWPQWARELVALIPEYGCWRDLWYMYTEYPTTRAAIDSVVKDQFMLDQETEHPSLLVKWLPREGSKYSSLAHHFAALLFPLTPAEKGQRMRTYRRALATLNRFADTTEIKMCGRTWSTITPSRVPGRLMKRCKHAFFNEKTVRARHGRETVEPRYPGNTDREECAQHFRDHIQDVAEGRTVMKGATTTMPHEHVHELLHSRGALSSDALSIIQAQWDAIRAEAAAGGGLGRLVAMCDFSGSMDGVPKEVSLALGILISELTSPAFRDHILTFDSEPRWCSFAAAGCKTLADKVASIGTLGQGLSTDFQKAADLILKKLVEHKVPREEAPADLLVLTDMGFDAACGGAHYGYNPKKNGWETHFQMIRRNFEAAGYEAPRIVCWNLRAEYKDFHATAGEVGVVQLSGWSPAVLKALQSGGVQVETPYMGLRRLLDAPRYDAVRNVVAGLF